MACYAMESLVAAVVQDAERGIHSQIDWHNALQLLHRCMRLAGRFTSLKGEERKQVVVSSLRILADKYADPDSRELLLLLCDNSGVIIDQLYALQPAAYKGCRWMCGRLRCR